MGVEDYGGFCVDERKIRDYLLKTGAKHYLEFVDVGYTAENEQKLLRDIRDGFDVKKTVEWLETNDCAEEFVIYMELGVTKKKLFKTVWRKENCDEKPRFITAYRVKEVKKDDKGI